MLSDRLPPGQFLGQRTGNWRLGAFELSESVYVADAVLKPHSHARAYLGLVVRGAHREVTSAHEHDCGPATVVFHPAGERHANTFCRAGGRIFRLEIDEAWLERVLEGGARLDRRVESSRGPLSQIASRIFSEFHARDGVSPLMIEGLALEFAAQIVRSPKSATSGDPPAWLAAVADYLHAHGAAEVRLEDLQRVAGVHPAHLNRAFRVRYGCSIGGYLRRLRVEAAARELAATKTPIADVAIAHGFADQSHFSRVFTKTTGLTPARYRRLYRSR